MPPIRIRPFDPSDQPAARALILAGLREHWGWLEPGTNPSTLYARKFMPLFWEKFLRDARYAQFDDGVIPDVVPAYPLKGRKTGDPAWAGNYPLLVWYLYEYFDDRRLLEEHYPIMKKWLDHLTAISAGPGPPPGGGTRPGRSRSGTRPRPTSRARRRGWGRS